MLTLINGVSDHSPMFGVTDSDIAPNSMIDTEGWRQQTFAIRNAKEEYNDCNFSMTGSHYIKIRGNKVSANNTVEIMNIFDFAPPCYTDRAYSHACSPDDIFYYFRPLLKGDDCHGYDFDVDADAYVLDPDFWCGFKFEKELFSLRSVPRVIQCIPIIATLIPSLSVMELVLKAFRGPHEHGPGWATNEKREHYRIFCPGMYNYLFNLFSCFDWELIESFVKKLLSKMSWEAAQEYWESIYLLDAKPVDFNEYNNWVATPEHVDKLRNNRTYNVNDTFDYHYAFSEMDLQE